jgi:hypothetical protein
VYWHNFPSICINLEAENNFEIKRIEEQPSANMEVDCDDELLAAEIMRLKQELEETLQQPKEFSTEDDFHDIRAKLPQLNREASQIDFIHEEACFQYMESDDDCSGDAMLSYDEITVDTAELMLFEEQESAEQQRSAVPSRTPSQLEALLQSGSPRRQRKSPYDSGPIVENTDMLDDSKSYISYDKSYISYDEVTVATADLFTELSLLDTKEVQNDPESDQLRNLLIDHISLKNSFKSPKPSCEELTKLVVNSTDITANVCEDNIETDESEINATETMEVVKFTALDLELVIADQGKTNESEQPIDVLPTEDAMCPPIIDSVPTYPCSSMDGMPNLLEEPARILRDHVKEEIDEATEKVTAAECLVLSELQGVPEGTAPAGESSVLSIDEEIRLMQEQMIKSPWQSPTKKELSIRLTASSPGQLHRPFEILSQKLTTLADPKPTPEDVKSPKKEGLEVRPPEARPHPWPEQKQGVLSNPIPKSPTLVSPIPAESKDSPPKMSPDELLPSSTPLSISSMLDLPYQKQSLDSKENQFFPVTNTNESPTHCTPPPLIYHSEILLMPQENKDCIAALSTKAMQRPERQNDPSATPEYPASSGKPKKTKTVRVRRVRRKVRDSTNLDDSNNNANDDLPSPTKEAKSPLSKSPNDIVLNEVQLNRVHLPQNLLSEIRLQKNGINDMHRDDESEVPVFEHASTVNDAHKTESSFSGTKSDQNDVTPRPPPMFNLLGAIENAATKRVQRLEETGGELIMQDIAPEVEAKPSKNPQLSTSMAEMISQRAASRDKRLADGGEKKMRKVVIKEKDEYKKDFSNIVGDAAMMGRLTRLNEYTVEAVAQPKKPEEEWKSNGLLAIQWKSAHMSVIHDAAAAGNAFKMPEEVVTNFPDEDDATIHDEAINQKFSDRMKKLILLDEKVGEGMRKVDSLYDGLKEQKPKLNSLLIKPMQSYSSVEDVQLPRKSAPKINPAKNAEKLSKMKREALQSGRPMIDISSHAAELAWERRARLDRPGSRPKVKETCPCPYCKSASPYQTYAYRELELQQKEHTLQHRQAQRLLQQPAREAAAPQQEMERQERQRAREARRKLQQEVAEVEAAVAKAMAEVEAAKAQQLNRAAKVPERAVITSSVSSPLVVTTEPPPEKAPPQSTPPKQNSLQDRIGEWNHVQISAAATKYKNEPPPSVDAAGCKCIIM